MISCRARQIISHQIKITHILTNPKSIFTHPQPSIFLSLSLFKIFSVRKLWLSVSLCLFFAPSTITRKPRKKLRKANNKREKSSQSTGKETKKQQRKREKSRVPKKYPNLSLSFLVDFSFPPNDISFSFSNFFPSFFFFFLGFPWKARENIFPFSPGFSLLGLFRIRIFCEEEDIIFPGKKKKTRLHFQLSP